jgi:hypothetical protein
MWSDNWLATLLSRHQDILPRWGPAVPDPTKKKSACTRGFYVHAQRSEGAKEIENILLLMRREVIEKRNDIVGLRAVAGVLLNSMDEPAILGAGSAIMQKEDALPQTPERRGTELIGPCRSLRNVIREPGAHVVDQ